MDEYIKREAAIELLSQPITMSMCLSTEECHHKIAQQRIDRYLIENIPATDVRPVVLCRECKHWETDWTPQGVSDVRHYCAPLDLFTSADWYCSDGEKREES